MLAKYRSVCIRKKVILIKEGIALDMLGMILKLVPLNPTYGCTGFLPAQDTLCDISQCRD